MQHGDQADDDVGGDGHERVDLLRLLEDPQFKPGCVAMEWSWRALWLNNFPRICTVQQADSHLAQDQRIKVSDVHAKLGVLACIQGFPVRGAPTVSAPNHPQCLVALDVFLGIFGMANHLDRSHFVVRPQTT